MKKNPLIKIIWLVFFLFLVCRLAQAQTSAFTYQGKLTDASAAAEANGQYDLTFRLFDAPENGTPIGAAAFFDNVPAAGGIFTVTLDFGANAFSDGAARFLEISVRAGASTGAFTTLAPRQQIMSAPYSVKSLSANTAETSLNSLNLGGAAANQFVQTNDARLSDNRNPLPSSPNYIQNRTTPQSLSDFNISGNGTVGGTLSGNAVNASSQFSIGGNRVLSNAGAQNLFAGIDAGAVNSGFSNSFFGASSGSLNGSGQQNSFFGRAAGAVNTTGSFNTFVGANAGIASNGGGNSFFGVAAGANNTSGQFNTFIGQSSGFANSTGSNNTLLGNATNLLGSDFTFATAVGAGATVIRSNQIMLGRLSASDEVYIPGDATINQHLAVDTIGVGYVDATDLTAQGKVGIGTFSPADRLEVNGIIRVNSLGAAGGAPLCRNVSNQIANCSSSLRYKINIAPFAFGLSFIKRLRPISFDWKQGGAKDIGFGAEDVARISPLFVTYNEKGEIEGVKYDRLSVVFVNAFQEQQRQIERQQKQIDDLKRIVCELKPGAEICR